MNKAIVFGCGPGLKEHAWDGDVEGRFRIGINRSFDLLWAPVGVTADLDFWLAEGQDSPVLKFAPLTWLYRGDFVNAPYWTKGASGPFGLWIAAQMGFTDILLVGFGGKGHFYGMDDDDRTELDRKLWQGIRELHDQGLHIRGAFPPPPKNVIWGRKRTA